MGRVTLIAGHAQSLVNFRGPLIEALLAEGHDVFAIGPDADRATLDWLSARRVGYHTVPISRASLDPVRDASTFWAIRSALSSIRPQVVIAYTVKAVIYGLLAARQVGVARRFAMITGLGYAFTDGVPSAKRYLVGGIVRTLYRFSLRSAEAVIFQNPDDLAVFKTLRLIDPRSRTGIVNGSGVDTEHFGPVPLPPDPACLMISRLVADKGVGEYLAAARIVKAARPHVTFRLVGPPDPNPAALPPAVLESAISDGVVEYLGEMQDVRPTIADTNIYVLPSYREGTPRSVLEAMSMGRPVITTDAPGCRETVEADVNGFLVPVKTTSELAEAILQMVDNSDLRQQMGDAGRARAVSRYSAKAVAQSAIDLLALRTRNSSIDAADVT